MWKLFESFIRNFYDNEQKKYNVRREHIDWQLKAAEDSDLSLLPKMETDISLESATEKIIIETKFYKEALVSKENTFNQALRNKKFHSKHLYQLFSYMKNTEAKGEEKALTGILLYPTVNYSLNESYFIGDTKLKIYTINLNQAWEGIHKDLLELI
jgi:5-methylcytosine-specific restriction enzyme subunit McrC